MSRFFRSMRPGRPEERQDDAQQQHLGGHDGEQSHNQHASQRGSRFINAVYYPNYRIYRDQPPSIMNINCITHIFYAFASLEADGTVHPSDEYADCNMIVDGVQGALRACVQLKQQKPDLKVVLSVGGGGNSKHFAAVAASSSLRTTFANSCKRLVDTYDLDGIDIDWEHPENTVEGANFTRLLASLRAQLPAPRYVLTAALPAGEWCLRHIPDLGAAAAMHLTALNLMAYDFSGPWTPLAAHHAALYAQAGSPSANAGVRYCISRRVPPSKILLGVPCYGRSFRGCGRPGQRHCGAGGDDGVFEFRDLPRPGAREDVDRAAVAAFCVDPDAGFVSYDNRTTVEAKARYVRQEGLAGLFYWTGTGDKSRELGLVDAGYTVLRS